MNIIPNYSIPLFEYLPSWERLSTETRHLLLEKMGPNMKADPYVFSSDQLQELRSEGFLEPDSFYLNNEFRPMMNLFASMYRHRHFDHDNPAAPASYVKEHLTVEQCHDTRFGFGHYRGWRNYKSLAEEASTTYWIKAFLDCTNYREWQPRMSTDKAMSTKKEFSVIQQWVNNLMNGPNPQPMTHLLSTVDNDCKLATQSFISALRMLLLFPAIDSQTFLPVVGVWPKIFAQWNKAPMTRPEPESLPSGSAVFSTPVLLHDITTLIVTASTEGLRLKKNSEILFKKERQRVEYNMLVLPEWLAYPADKEQRAELALRWLIQLKYVSTKKDLLTDVAAGRRWLAGTETERLKALHDGMRSMKRSMTRGHYLTRDELSFMPDNPQQCVRKGAINLEDYVEQAFADLPVGAWIDLETYLLWCCENRNPFKVQFAEMPTDYQLSDFYQHDDEYREKCWHPFLISFLFLRLLPLGGVALAQTSGHKLLFSLTLAGSYLLGTSDVFEYETEKADGAILIQPDFTVVFTAPNISAETELLPFSDRIGQNVGTLFKITQQSILTALHANITSAQMVKTLTKISSTPPPQNVLQQIRDWGSAYRKVDLKQIWTIDCPDKETAARIVALLPNDATLITKTLIKINATSNAIPRIKKTLKANSIGIH